jgi:hypothetical protein
MIPPTPLAAVTLVNLPVGTGRTLLPLEDSISSKPVAASS